jgi:hypothetical protein
MIPETVEIQPRVVQNAIIAGILCAMFAIGGIYMLISAESPNDVLGGLLCVLFFGGCGLYSIPKLLRRKVPIVLTPRGLEQRYAEGTAFIPWEYIERVGIVSVASSKMVGIRLRSYDRYLETMSPGLAEVTTKRLPYMKLFTRAASLLEVPTAVKVWSKLEGTDLKAALRGFGNVGTLAQSLLWARQNFGYDLALSWVEIDRPAREFVKLLERYLVEDTVAA